MGCNEIILTVHSFLEGIEEGSRYRYPPGVQAVKTHHVASERSADTIQLIPQSLREAELNENDEADASR